MSVNEPSPIGDYDALQLKGATGVTTTFTDITNIVPDGCTLKILSLTLSETAGTAGLVTIQMITAVAGLFTPSSTSAQSQVVKEWQLGASTSHDWNEDDLKLTVPAGWKLQAKIGAGTLDVQISGRYISGSA